MFLKKIRWYNRMYNKLQPKRLRKNSNLSRDDNKNNSKVGIVLPVYDQERNYLMECIQAIENQTFRNFQLVIVIDGANEETVKAIYEASEMLTCSYSIIHRTENKGIAYSLNEGYEHLLDCPYLTWISSDNRQKPDFLKRLVETMNNAPSDTVLVYSMYQPIDEQGLSHSFGLAWYTALFNMMRRPKEEIMLTCFIGASFLFTREAYEKADGYDPKYGLVSDYEFWIRLMPLGNFHFIPESLMEYRLNGKHSLTTITPTEELFIQSMDASVDHRQKNGDIPKVTVIITAHNHEKYIKNCIQSVLDQTYSNFHIVVLDVGSTDGTLQEVYSVRDLRLIPVHLDKRHKAEALNIGLRYVLGKYVLELDGDDWIDSNTLEIMVNEMDALSTKVGMTFANRQIWFEENGQLVEGPVYKGVPSTNKYEVLQNFQTHCPRMYRLSALKKLNGWMTSLYEEPLVADDFMMYLRVAEQFKVHWIDETLYHQRRHPQNITVIEKELLNRQFRMITNEMLQRWGNEYTADFEEVDGNISKILLR
ncbi:glycosyltransferase [Bacillus sp. FJAT-22090]|uniref:glycosyltransferase family 2 protein n=1 Tax=Bacillus sp. FJAT-22090 TaxID=1581038 RepID=UPI0016434F5F|nr:glycosyltransferase [Bacillus sp. FJAT-22090]